MQPSIIRWVAALCVLGVMLGGRSVTGQGGEPPKHYFPFIGANVPAQLDPAFRDYVGVVVSDADGDGEIYTIRGDSSDLQQLTHNEVADSDPRFSPDGAQIAFIRTATIEGTADLRYQLLLINRDGSDEQLLFETQGDAAEADFTARWSPRGQQLLFYGQQLDARAWMVGTDGSVQELGSVYAESLQWSPDGHYFSYITYATGMGVLWVHNVFAQSSIRVVAAVTETWWAPDSRELLLRQGDDLALMHPDTGELRMVATGGYLPYGWLRNGQEILLKLQRADDQNFYTLARTGGDPVPLTTSTAYSIAGQMDEDHVGLLYQNRATSGANVELYWLPFDTRTSHYLQTYNAEVGVSVPVLSQDHRTLRYTLSRCSLDRCNRTSYQVNLEDESSVPVMTEAPLLTAYLPNSSNRASVQENESLNNYTITMVQLEPLTLTPLDFPASPSTRYVAEWKYLP